MTDNNIAARQIITIRVLPFNRQLVYKAFTQPEHLAAWWGPKGFTNTFEKFDLQPGGDWIFVMHGPDGKNYPNHSVFDEIIEPSKLVFDHVVPPIFRATFTFEEAENNSTLLTFTMLFETAEVREAIKKIVVPANEENIDRLEVVLQKLAS